MSDYLPKKDYGLNCSPYVIPEHDYDVGDMIYGTIIYGPRRGVEVRGPYCGSKYDGTGRKYIVLADLTHEKFYGVVNTRHAKRPILACKPTPASEAVGRVCACQALNGAQICGLIGKLGDNSVYECVSLDGKAGQVISSSYPVYVLPSIGEIQTYEDMVKAYPYLPWVK